MPDLPDLPDLLVLRHGETEWNVQNRMQGRLDSPLTERGLAQARALAQVAETAGAGFGWISSPQGRALETARIASPPDTPIRTDPRLGEIGMGAWTGRSLNDIAAVAPQCFAPEAGPMGWYGKAPGSETVEEVAARCCDFLAALAAPAVVVSHGITGRVLRCLALGLPARRFADLEAAQGVGYLVSAGRHFRVEGDTRAELTLPAPA